MRRDELMLDHQPTPRAGAAGRKRISTYDLAKLAFFFVGVPRNSFGSIDATNRCNLRCRHCYYYEQDIAEELSVEEWVCKLEGLRRHRPRWEFPFFNCSWVGGEPLLRPQLITRCKAYFRYNTVVTNGTIPLPDWRDISWYVSIDGDEETHEFLRDKRGAYGRALDNVKRNAHLNITIAYCISKYNAHCIERVVKDWHAAGAQHITFDFYTPVEGLNDDELWVSLAERDSIIEKLVALRRVYGDFFVVPERVFRLMRSDHCQAVTDSCLLRSRSFAFDAGGRPKGKCVMGEKADCTRCGCVVPYYLRSVTDRKQILQDLALSAAQSVQRLFDRTLGGQRGGQPRSDN